MMELGGETNQKKLKILKYVPSIPLKRSGHNFYGKVEWIGQKTRKWPITWHISRYSSVAEPMSRKHQT